jgi:antitoxin ParD1/3/4
MDITLRPELEQFVRERIAAGQFADLSEAVNGALDLLKEQEATTPADLAELREAVRIGIEQLDRGEGAPWDPEEIKSQGRKILAARKQ